MTTTLTATMTTTLTATTTHDDHHERYYDRASMTYRVELDAELCVSAGKCVASAPGFFVFDADEIATVDRAGDRAGGRVGDRPTDEALVRIARACPSEAISLFDGDEAVEL